jgi:hypothetical protein
MKDELGRNIPVTLTRAELVLLQEALAKLGNAECFESTLNEAEKRTIWNLECVCERLNDKAFSPNYDEVLASASAMVLKS